MKRRKLEFEAPPPPKTECAAWAGPEAGFVLAGAGPVEPSAGAGTGNVSGCESVGWCPAVGWCGAMLPSRSGWSRGGLEGSATKKRDKGRVNERVKGFWTQFCTSPSLSSEIQQHGGEIKCPAALVHLTAPLFWGVFPRAVLTCFCFQAPTCYDTLLFDLLTVLSLIHIPFTPLWQWFIV